MLERPDFIIVGGQFDGKAYLLASRKVRSIEISQENGYGDIYGGGHRIWSSSRININSEVVDFTQVIGDDYGQAWSTLFDGWAPPGPRQLEQRNA